MRLDAAHVLDGALVVAPATQSCGQSGRSGSSPSGQGHSSPAALSCVYVGAQLFATAREQLYGKPNRGCWLPWLGPLPLLDLSQLTRCRCTVLNAATSSDTMRASGAGVRHGRRAHARAGARAPALLARPDPALRVGPRHSAQVLKIDSFRMAATQCPSLWVREMV